MFDAYKELTQSVKELLANAQQALDEKDSNISYWQGEIRAYQTVLALLEQ